MQLRSAIVSDRMCLAQCLRLQLSILSLQTQRDTCRLKASQALSTLEPPDPTVREDDSLSESDDSDLNPEPQDLDLNSKSQQARGGEGGGRGTRVRSARASETWRAKRRERAEQYGRGHTKSRTPRDLVRRFVMIVLGALIKAQKLSLSRHRERLGSWEGAAAAEV